jgi:hypothetical protein
MGAKELLEQLEDAYSQRDLLMIDYNQARDNAIPDEVQAALADIDVEFLPKKDAIEEKIAELEEQVKAAVIEGGQTVKVGALMAMYMRGRVSWDNKKLEGMMALIPDLAKARNEGKPTVQIRTVK